MLTRLCTRVIYPQEKNEDPVFAIEERSLDMNYKPLHKEFIADLNMDKEEILGIIEKMQREGRRKRDRRIDIEGRGRGYRRLL